jgi:hypothetical protein
LQNVSRFAFGGAPSSLTFVVIFDNIETRRK